MGEKKQKEATGKRVKQILVITACVLFAVLMVVSGMGSGWISSFAAVKPGDTVVIDYTFYTPAGNAIVTTQEPVYTQAAAKNRTILGSRQLTITANITTERPIYAVPVYPSGGGGMQQFAIFSTEYNAISSGIVGMKTNEQKRISVPTDTPMTQVWSAEQLARARLNASEISVGESFFLGISDNPQEMASNTSAITYLRVGEVTAKMPQGIVVDFSYPEIEVQVVSISKR